MASQFISAVLRITASQFELEANSMAPSPLRLLFMASQFIVAVIDLISALVTAGKQRQLWRRV